MSSASGTVQLLILERREPAANMARFYVLSLEETLFGDTALVREWGRLGTEGRRRLDLFDRRVKAVEALESWLGRKLQRGYRTRAPAQSREVSVDLAAGGQAFGFACSRSGACQTVEPNLTTP